MNLVSIIIPTFNRAEKIKDTINSVLSQDYSKIEIIIIDDGSTDGTDLVVEKIVNENWSSGKVVRYISKINEGACVARNIGMMEALGSYIMFLDSDDIIHPNCVSAQVSHIEQSNSQCAICDFECVDETGNLIRSFANNIKPIDFIATLRSPSISTVMMRRNSIPPGLQWNKNLKRIQDMDFMYKYFSCVKKYVHVNKFLFQYVTHGGERITDSYSKGFQYNELRRSFRDFVHYNSSALSEDPKALKRLYFKALRRHQLRSFLFRITPRFIKEFIKKFCLNNPYLCKRLPD